MLNPHPADLYHDALGWRALSDGERVLVLYPKMQHLHLAIGPVGTRRAQRIWQYPHELLDVATDALRTFDGEGDPDPGWTKRYDEASDA